MATFTVWTLDVWGNARDGYEVNDRCRVGTVQIPDDCLACPADTINALPTPDERHRAFHAWGERSDRGIVSALVAGGYLAPRARVSVEGEPDCLSIDRARDGYPLLQLERID